MKVWYVVSERCLLNKSGVFSNESGVFFNESGVFFNENGVFSNESGVSPARAVSLKRERCLLIKSDIFSMLSLWYQTTNCPIWTVARNPSVDAQCGWTKKTRVVGSHPKMSAWGSVRGTWRWAPTHVENRPWGNPSIRLRRGISGWSVGVDLARLSSPQSGEPDTGPSSISTTGHGGTYRSVFSLTFKYISHSGSRTRRVSPSSLLHPLLLTTGQMEPIYRDVQNQSSALVFPLLGPKVNIEDLAQEAATMVLCKNKTLRVCLDISLLVKTDHILYQLHSVPVVQSIMRNSSGWAYVCTEFSHLALTSLVSHIVTDLPSDEGKGNRPMQKLTCARNINLWILWKLSVQQSYVWVLPTMWSSSVLQEASLL